MKRRRRSREIASVDGWLYERVKAWHKKAQFDFIDWKLHWKDKNILSVNRTAVQIMLLKTLLVKYWNLMSAGNMVWGEAVNLISLACQVTCPVTCFTNYKLRQWLGYSSKKHFSQKIFFFFFALIHEFSWIMHFCSEECNLTELVELFNFEECTFVPYGSFLS